MKNNYTRTICLVLMASTFMISKSFAQTVNGTITDAETKGPLVGVGIAVNKNKPVVVSNSKGQFSIIGINAGDTLVFTNIGYLTTQIPISRVGGENISVSMRRSVEELEEVIINTGYQMLPRERATGSYSIIGSKDLENTVSADIMSRLEGYANSLSFELPYTSGEPSSSADIRLRGVSTINGDTKPLIVLDNFPYEGDILNINPNDVESVTILKDAAATSIWGARAGNGVIVITSKSGKYSQETQIRFSSNISLGAKPDLFYDRGFIPSADLVELERTIYEMGLYRVRDEDTFTPAVEALAAHDAGRINETELNNRLESLKDYDIRYEALEHLYRTSSHQQYSLNISGGTPVHRYNASAGYDRSLGSLINNSTDRVTFRTSSEIKILDKLRIGSSISLAHTKSQNNGIGINDIRPSGFNRIYTYAGLMDKNGNHLPIVKNNSLAYTDRALEMGLMDWHYRPLDELALNDNSGKSQDIILKGSIVYDFMQGFNIEGRYLYQTLRSDNINHYVEESYHVRHLYNQFTQTDGSSVIPLGGILRGSMGKYTAHSGRLQMNFSRTWNDEHSVSSLAGAELRQEVRESGQAFNYYGYDDEVGTMINLIDYSKSYPVRPRGNARIQNGNSPGNLYTDRFVSYFGNIGYSYQGKYTLSLSGRWDASNLFGVNFNQKGIPLWSSGVAWELGKEDFYDISWLPRLNLRLTYGISGNVNRSTSALPYITYTTNTLNGYHSAMVTSPGDPDLRWEKVGITNIGLDMGLLRDRLTASFEYYQKKGSDLIGENPIDPTSGVMWTGSRYNMSNLRNYADMKTDGFDAELNYQAKLGKVKWNSSIMASYVYNRVTNYIDRQIPTINSYLVSFNPPVIEGNPVDALYTIPWNGLNEEGDPLVLVDGGLGTDYNAYFNNLSLGDLQFSGVTRPSWFGSVRNELSYKNLSFGFNILWKAGYNFKRASLSYSGMLGSGLMHIDYLDRWQQPGDEEKTGVPSLPDGSNARRDQAYTFSDLLVERGDHIRLYDINVSYTWNSTHNLKRGLKNITFFAYAKNLGIIWRHNNHKLDPDSHAFYPIPFQFSIGLKAGIL